MPSRRAPVTLEFKYWRTGAPWGGASAGMAKLGSGSCEVAREEVASPPLARRAGVPVRGGGRIGAGVMLVGTGVGMSYVCVRDNWSCDLVGRN